MPFSSSNVAAIGRLALALAAAAIFTEACATNEFDSQYGGGSGARSTEGETGAPASTDSAQRSEGSSDGGTKVSSATGGDGGVVSTTSLDASTLAADAGTTPVMVDNSVGTNQGVMFGVNGHPIQRINGTGPYATTSFAQQMQSLASLGLRHLRMDLYHASNDQYAILDDVLAAAKPVGVVVTPILISLVGADEDSSYQTGYAVGLGYATKYAGVIHSWELGNEENGSILDPFADGSNPQTFTSSPAYALKRGKLRGLIDGIRAGDPNAKVGVGDAGGCNYGFTQALWNDGLRWDITVFHPYDFWGDIDNRGSSGTHCSEGDNMLAKHAAFGKPIWLTEFSDTIAVKAADKTSLGTGVVKMMANFRRLASQYDIEVADVYELYDESSKAGAEAHFGIFDAEAAGTATTAAIQTYLTANPSFVYAQ